MFLNRKSKSLKPELVALEDRQLLTTVILADIDTGANPIASWADISFKGAVPTAPLGNYLVQQYNTIRGPAVPEGHIDHAGTNGHGSIMAAYYAAIMEHEGHTPLVEEIAAGDATNFTSDAIGRALQFVDSQQRAANAAHQDVRYVVSLPVEPGIWGSKEWFGRYYLKWDNVPLSQAAGNDSSDLRYAGPYPGEITMEAADINGNLYPYSNRGPTGTPYCLLTNLGTSGAAIGGAAWLAVMEENYPGTNADTMVSKLHSMGTLGSYPQVVNPNSTATPLTTDSSIPIAPAHGFGFAGSPFDDLAHGHKKKLLSA